MANKMLAGLKNSKTRALILLGGTVVLIVVVVIVTFSRKSNPLKTEESQTSKIPQITAIPGQVTSEKYQELQEADNRRRAEIAKKTGGSSVATLIGTRDKDSLAKRESFGIEGDFKNVDCPCISDSRSGTISDLDPALAARLMSQIEANPNDALRLMKENPGLAKTLCAQKPELALKIIENNKEAAKIMLNECPAMAKMLAEKNPALFKQLMLENPELAKKIAQSDPELIKKLMLQDPEFAKQMARMNPEVLKNLMKDDPDFTEKMYKQNPEIIKELMKNDPAFATALGKNNPGIVKKLMLEDPEFARMMAKNNPEMVKELMKNDPDFTKALASSNPTLVKELMKNDPTFADMIAKQDPDLVKKLMLDDPEFAKIMASKSPNMVAALMENDPEFSKALLAANPGLKTIIESNRKKMPFANDKQRAQTLEDAHRKQREEQARRTRQVQLTEQQQKQMLALVANMDASAKTAIQSWNELATQQFVQGDKTEKGSDSAAVPSADNLDKPKKSGSSADTDDILIKAGSIIFAVLDTAVNTDEAGPVMATITSGVFKGSKLLGEIQLANQVSGLRPEKVILNFSTLSPADQSKSIPIKGVAIDPDTARTALASDVDHHYLLRYGTLLASSFMTGYAKVIAAQGTVQTSSTTGTTTTTTPPLNGRQQIFASLGEVGKKVGDATSAYFTSPNTITVHSGTGFGLLILNDVTH